MDQAANRENRLAQETSPYLLQHRNNPVDWWPWGPPALEEAQRSNKPILLSVGYAACHWCHVMAHESFEDDATAAVMNNLFVNIKVDREERPDIDQIYMSALHHLGEQGGWPLTMFLTPAGEPFWGGTYFPKQSGYGRPAFVDVLREVSRLFNEEPNKIEQNRGALMERLAERSQSAGRIAIRPNELDGFAMQVARLIDTVNGGLRGAPKFPQCAILEFLWRAGLRHSNSSSSPRRREAAKPGDPSSGEKTEGRVIGERSDAVLRTAMPGHDAGEDGSLAEHFFELVEHTLERICEGGIYDHLGGGFSRYSVDERWLVPHFEKMLYDNAQLLELLALAHARSGNALFRTRAVETVEWLKREMTTEGGGFSASLDADSEGEEGKFYVWSADEIETLLGAEDAAFFARYYDVTPGGNFEGHNILNRLEAPPRSNEDETRLTALRAKLLAARGKRVRPGLDDKVLADWNGLMIAALANAGALLGEQEWIALATRAFNFVASDMTRADRLGHSFRDGRLLYPGLASDFAAMIKAALALHETTGERRFLDTALSWQAALDRHYKNEGNGGYYLTADDAEGLVVRPAATADDATPNPNAIAAQNLIRLAVLAGNAQYRTQADGLIGGVLSAAGTNLFGHMALLNAVDFRIGGAEIVIAGHRADALVDAVLRLPFLRRILVRAMSAEALPPDHPAQEKIKAASSAAAFVCVGQTCSLPVTTAEEIAEVFGGMRAV